MNFNKIIKKEEILKVIDEKGFDKPTEIQEKIIPIINDGFDVLGKSQTGTGKTLAFAAPLLSEIKCDKSLQTLILAPTRELAMQIYDEVNSLSKYMKNSSLCVFGSSSIENQIKRLKSGCEIVIGTPGRVKDLIKRKKLKIEHIKYFVLDEADEMLSMGFQEDLEFILGHTNSLKQTLMFSATMPKQILFLAKKYMKEDYKTVSIKEDIKSGENIIQYHFDVNEKTRLESLCRVLDYKNPNKAIIFTKTKKNADEVLAELVNKGYKADVIHGDIVQNQRTQTLKRFKEGTFNYLIATDVAARGIHVDDVELVINYNLPENKEAYVHRIGRTGRANKTGVAVTFVSPREKGFLNVIKKHVNKNIEKKELPRYDEIVPTRVEDIITKIKQSDLSNSKDLFTDYLSTLENQELIQLTNSLLENYIKTNLGSDFSKNLEVKEKKQRSKSGVRLFVNYGSLDNITKSELLNFIEKAAKVPKGTCYNVEMLPKFTFLNVKENEVEKILKSCNNKKLKKRIIKFEIAKN